MHNHTARESLARTIAHELGHGWFRLEHSWQTYPTLTQGSSDNLMDYGAGTRLRKYQWDFVHDPISMLGWFQDEDDVSDYNLDTDKEWVVEIYSPWYSKEFATALGAKDQAVMSKWINKGLTTTFTPDQVSSLAAISKVLPRKRDGSVPVAIIKHYPKAKHKGLYVYYCEKKGAVVQAVEKPIVFTTDLPVDLSLHTGEFDNPDEKAAPMKEETVQAYANLPYDFVWQTMTEQGVVDKTANLFKEILDHPNVGREEGVVRYLMDIIAKAEFGKSPKYSMDKKVIYTYEFELDKKKVPLALHILEDDPSFKRNELIALDLGNSEKKPYAVLAFCEDEDPTKAKILVQVGKEYVDGVNDYFSSDKEKLASERAKRINNAITEMQVHLGKEYEQESGSLRTENTKKGLKKMDCSEFVSRYIQKVTGAEKVPEYTTASLIEFYDNKSSDFVTYITDSDKKDFKDIRAGDIFLWRGISGGHTGIVVAYNEETDKVTVVEAIGNSASSEESLSKAVDGYCKGCIRKSIYTRTGRALYQHDGWYGYFRPKTSAK